MLYEHQPVHYLPLEGGLLTDERFCHFIVILSLLTSSLFATREWVSDRGNVLSF